jgi:hypothetical protein
MPTSTIGTATVGTTQVAATAVTGWSATTPCSQGVLVSLPADASGKMYYRFVTGANDTTAAVHIPNGVPFTINPSGLFQGGLKATLSNLFFVSDTVSQAFTAEAIG